MTTRLYCAALLIAFGAADGAHAASIETFGAPKASPSIIYLGTPAPQAKPAVQAVAAADMPALHYPTEPPVELAIARAPASGTRISASIIALGEPGIEDVKVAAVPKKTPHAPEPIVLRGGVWGDGSAEPAPVVALPAKPDAAPADTQREASATPSQQPKAPATPEPPAPGVGSVR